jgi:hypothetical protein
MSARLLAAGFTVHGLDNSPTTWAALADADQAPSSLRAGEPRPGRQVGRCCCSMYCLMIDRGAPPHEAAK